MAATYRTPDTCASDCPLFIDGKPKCYASAGAGGGSFALAKKYGLFWGGDYKNRPDEMHFEINVSPRKVRELIEALGLGEK
jgi:hypothetical protein